MWNNFHNLRHAVSKCIKQCKQRTKTLGNIWGIMGLYGRVWESQAKQKNKNIYTSLKGYEEGLEAMLSKMFFTYLQAPTESLCRPRDIMIYHDGFVGTFWYILIYSKNIPSKLTSDIHWQSIYIESKSIYTSYHGFASSRGIESILFISNPTRPDAPFFINFLHSFAQIQTSAQSDRMTCNRLISSDHTGMYRTLPQYYTIQVQWHELILQISCVVWECMRLYEMVWEYLTFSKYGHKMSNI